MNARHAHAGPGHDHRTIRALARSVYRKLQCGGLPPGAMIEFASAILDLVRDDYRGDAPTAP